VKSVSAGLVFPCGTECREDPVGKLKERMSPLLVAWAELTTLHYGKGHARMMTRFGGC
jgi:hypothetical protein